MALLSDDIRIIERTCCVDSPSEERPLFSGWWHERTLKPIHKGLGPQHEGSRRDMLSTLTARLGNGNEVNFKGN